VLNSDVIEFCIRVSAPVVKDGFIRYRKQFLRTLPIPCPSILQQRMLVQTAMDGGSLDRAIARLFGLTEGELERMRAYVHETRDNHAPTAGAR